MKTSIYTLLICFVFCFSQANLNAQIDDIKKKSDQNKSKKKENSYTPGNDSNGSNSIGEACVSGCVSGCFDFAFSVFAQVLAEYTAEVYQKRFEDPSLMSFEVHAGFAPVYHYSQEEFYWYMNYLPGIRANLAAFMLDFRFNLLAEFKDNVPNTFKSWDALIGFNIVPSFNYKLTLGTGVQRENHSGLYFHQYYLANKIVTDQKRNYLDLDVRFSVDYETKEFPFFEAGIKYNYKLVELNNVYVHLTLGGMYQNYYRSHDIWGIKTGVILNLH
jgi:hypothetical protein